MICILNLTIIALLCICAWLASQLLSAIRQAAWLSRAYDELKAMT